MSYYDQASIERLANAISNIYAAAAGYAGDGPNVEVVRDFGKELDSRNIALTFIGEEFTWIFDRSKSTFSVRLGGQRPPGVTLQIWKPAG